MHSTLHNALVFLGWLAATYTIIMILLNGVIMLASPRSWFKLPGWLRPQGTFTEKEYSAGWGSVRLRFMGAVFVGAISWLIYSLFQNF
jgi:hypothetical protein